MSRGHPARATHLLASIALASCGGGLDAHLADEPSGLTASATRPTSSLVAPPEATTTPRDTARAVASDVTRSPWPIEERDDDVRLRDRELALACGVPDGALERAARHVAESRAKGLGTPDVDRIAWLLRALGEPHPRPRVLAATGRGPIDEGTLRGRIASLKTARSACGVASAHTPHGGEVVVAVAVDALADMEPLKTVAAPGEWLTLDAHVHVPHAGATVLLTSDRGRPRSVPVAHDPETGAVRARFALERPGSFTVQLVADVGGGPRPLLEARVHAGAGRDDPDAELPSAPGEEVKATDEAGGVAAMIQALRETEGLPPLARAPRLDALARAHATRMRDDASVAHDLGEGDLRLRFESEGLFATAVGENVAHAPTAARAHRILYASPSHRRNLLDASYTHLGIAEARAPDGTLYLCEIFASNLRGTDRPPARPHR